MSQKFHVNPETGASGLCRASKRPCPLGGSSGTENHYNTREEAENASQALLQDKHGTFSTNKRKTFEEPTKMTIPGYGTDGWKGSKRPDGYISNKDVAKKIRQDLKDATAAGHLPAGLKYSVTSPNNSVELTVTGFGRDRDIYEYDFTKPSGRNKSLKPEYKKTIERLENIHDSYNYDTSNIMADYFNRGYYGQVTVLTENYIAFQEYETTKNKINKIIRDKKKSGMTDDQILEDKEFKEMSERYDNALKSYYVTNKASHLEYEYTSQGKVPNWEEIDEISERYAEDNLNKVRERRKGKETEPRR